MLPVRVSIKNYLIPYLDSVGAELGTNDYTEIVNHLLRESKRQSGVAQNTQGRQTATNDDLADTLSEFLTA